MAFSREIGAMQESLACNYLQQQGLSLIERNFRCAQGEIDLIMIDQNKDPHELVFVEVRYRVNPDFGHPLETVDARKQSKLKRTALHYLHRLGTIDDQACRFDVVALQPEMQFEPVLWIKNAIQ